MTRRINAFAKRSTAIAGAALLVGAFGSACTSTQEEAPPPTPPTGSEFDQGAVQRPAPTPAPQTERVLDLQTVYFDYDRAEIRADARPALSRNAEALRASGDSITIEGHCDERGDEEYNLALGERRATAVKRYLENLGVRGRQLRTVSFGESKPAVIGRSEAAWSKNRRAEFRTGS